MKSRDAWNNFISSTSPPARGAWIEISAFTCHREAEPCRPPHGGRGLKFYQTGMSMADMLSPPARGAWIEISGAASTTRKATVAPRTGGVD